MPILHFAYVFVWDLVNVFNKSQLVGGGWLEVLSSLYSYLEFLLVFGVEKKGESDHFLRLSVLHLHNESLILFIVWYHIDRCPLILLIHKDWTRSMRPFFCHAFLQPLLRGHVFLKAIKWFKSLAWIISLVWKHLFALFNAFL